MLEGSVRVCRAGDEATHRLRADVGGAHPPLGLRRHLHRLGRQLLRVRGVRPGRRLHLAHPAAVGPVALLVLGPDSLAVGGVAAAPWLDGLLRARQEPEVDQGHPVGG